MAKVLLLEADKLVADNVRELLKRDGHQTDWQVEAQAAIDAADHDSPEVIILDVALARRSGIEFIYELRSYHDWAAIPIIIYSSLPADELPIDRAAASRMGVIEYLQKSRASLSELRLAVARFGGNPSTA